MKKMLCFFVILCGVFFVNGCSPTSQMLFPRPLDPNAMGLPKETQQLNTFPLDVLFVIESSNRVSVNQERLIHLIEYFFGYLYSRQIIDPHIKVVVASSQQVVQSEVFTNQTFNEVFQNGNLDVNRFKLSEISELGLLVNNQGFLDAVSKVLEPDQRNMGFYRDKAPLLIFFIGNKDQSQIASAGKFICSFDGLERKQKR